MACDGHSNWYPTSMHTHSGTGLRLFEISVLFLVWSHLINKVTSNICYYFEYFISMFWNNLMALLACLIWELHIVRRRLLQLTPSKNDCQVFLQKILFAKNIWTVKNFLHQINFSRIFGKIWSRVLWRYSIGYYRNNEMRSAWLKIRPLDTLFLSFLGFVSRYRWFSFIYLYLRTTIFDLHPNIWYSDPRLFSYSSKPTRKPYVTDLIFSQSS